MAVHLKVAQAFEPYPKAAVPRQLREHVVEKASPVEISDAPPSRESVSVTSVSLVLRFIVALRMGLILSSVYSSGIVSIAASSAFICSGVPIVMRRYSLSSPPR